MPQARTRIGKEAAHSELEAGRGAPPLFPDTRALFTEVTPEVASSTYGAGALFLDARRTAACGAGHIAGAGGILAREHDADARSDALRNCGVPFERNIVVYCSGATCDDSARLAEKLALTCW